MSQRETVEGDAAVPVVEEELQVGTAEVPTETVRIHTTVHEEEHVIDTPLRHGRFEVTRVPIDRVVEQPEAERREGDTLVIPVLEEIVTVQMKYRIVEEIHVRTIHEEQHHHEVVRTRRSQATISRD